MNLLFDTMPYKELIKIIDNAYFTADAFYQQSTFSVSDRKDNLLVIALFF